MSIQIVEIAQPSVIDTVAVAQPSTVALVEIRQGPAGDAGGGSNNITSATESNGTADLDLLNVDTVTATVSGTLTADHIHGNLAGNVYGHIRAGENLAKGDPVYVSGSHGSGSTLIPIVSKADASNAAKMPAIGIMDAGVTIHNNGHMVIVGTITELDTDGLTVNSELYVAAGGGMTATPPTARAQPVARVERVNANNGAVIVKVNGLSASDATANTLVRRTANGDASFGALTTSGLTVTGGTTFGEESLLQFNAIEYYYGTGAASAHRIALGAGTTGAELFGAATAAAARTTLGLSLPIAVASGGTGTTNGSITGSGALTFNGTSIVLQTGGTTRATVSSVGIDLADGHYLRTFGAPDATANFRFGANSALDGLAHVVRNSDSFKLLQFGSVALNFMGGYDLIGRPSGIALGGQITGESIRLASVTGNITTIGTIATTSTTASTSTTTGALVVSGGAGIAGAVNVGGGATVAGNVGIGTATPGGRLHVSGPDFPVALFERASAAFNAPVGACVLKSTSSADMVDGYGPFFTFLIRDTANTDNGIADFGAVRTGADNSGSLVFRTYTAGTVTEKVRIIPSGNVGIGTTTPASKLDVVGAIKSSATIQTGGYTFATLPTPATGMRAYITDGAAVPIYMANAAGGGSTVTPVFYNGSNWINA